MDGPVAVLESGAGALASFGGVESGFGGALESGFGGVLESMQLIKQWLRRRHPSHTLVFRICMGCRIARRRKGRSQRHSCRAPALERDELRTVKRVCAWWWRNRPVPVALPTQSATVAAFTGRRPQRRPASHPRRSIYPGSWPGLRPRHFQPARSAAPSGSKTGSGSRRASSHTSVVRKTGSSPLRQSR